jgi:membrane-associated phospholipid phosphatase
MTPWSWLEKRYGTIRFRLADINCLAYLGLMAVLLVFFHKAVPNWPGFALLHLAIILVILEIVRLGERPPRRRVLWFLRIFYPVVVILFGWGEVDALGRMFFGSYWATDLIIRAEQLIWSGSSAAWFQKVRRPWLDELMAIFYASYYLFLISATLPLFIKKKYEQTLAVLSLGTFVTLVNYFLFYLIPVLSPAMADASNLAQRGTHSGYLVSAFVHFVQSKGAVRGGTFPSSHISEALIWSLAAFRYNRKVGAVFLAVVPGVVVSTVYLKYHYALDPLFGLLLAAVLYPVALKIVKARGEDPLSSVPSR